jgi:sodium transport system permease protein
MKTWAILKKELLDGLRDRRSLVAALAFALLGPALIVVSINVAAVAGRDSAIAPIRLCGAGTAPDLVAHLKANGLTLDDAASICVDVPADFEAALAAGKTAHVRVLADLTTAGPTTARIERAIGAYSRAIAAKRLMARGVAPQLVSPIAMELQSTNNVSRVAALIGYVLVVYIAFAPFIVVYAMAGDATAGERERHSLQALLGHPVRTEAIVAGKFLALAAVSLAGTAACVAFSLALVGHSDVAELGLRVETGFAAGAQVFFLLAPLCLLVAALQLALGLFAKTVKEAQQTSMLLSFVPVVVGFLLVSRPSLSAGPWPLVWELRALTAPLLGSTSAVAPFPAVAGLELAAAALVLLAGARRLRSERVLG